MIPLIAAELEQYIRDRLPPRDPVRAEMEREAEVRDIPIVGPAVAALLEILASSIGARRVFELGSAIGYSTAAFARSVGPGGTVFYTDGNPANAREAAGYLERLGWKDRVVMLIGDAVESLDRESGLFDVIFIDIDKEDYPRALESAAPRVRPGGYLLADNVLWSGRVADPAVSDASTEGIREFNRRLFARTEFRSVILPLRDGVLVARREN